MNDLQFKFELSEEIQLNKINLHYKKLINVRG
jgi:hypothetical protein